MKYGQGIILAFLVLIAAFAFTFSELIKAQTIADSLRAQLQVKIDREAMRTTLLGFYASGARLGGGDVKTAEQYDAYRVALTAWQSEVDLWIGVHMRVGAAEFFEDTSLDGGARPAYSYSPAHAYDIFWVANRRRRLLILAGMGEWDKQP